MTKQLVCSYANQDQKLTAYRNVHEFWSGGRTLEEHLQWRSTSPQHNRAKWCVGCIDDRVVTSLGCYPLQLHWDGQQVAGILIGAVHTLPAFRGHGYAPQLLSWVEQQEQQQGVCVSGLFSDIDPNYYSRFGYEQCDGWEMSMKAGSSAALPASQWLLEPIDPQQHLARIQAWYETAQQNLSVWVVRDDDYWQYMLAKSATDQFFLLVDGQQQEQGYVRVHSHDDCWLIQDWGLSTGNQSDQVAMIAAIRCTAFGQGVTSIVGWLPRLEEPLDGIDFELRPQEITMFKRLDTRLSLSAAIIQDSAYIRGIDHV